MSRFTGRRKFVVLGVALVALAFGVSVGLARSGPSRSVVPVQLFNANCGFPTTKKFIGKATFTSDKGLLKVNGKIHGGIPGKYDMFLYDGGSCNFLADLDTFKVDGSGDGDFHGAIVIPGQSFFVDLYNRDLGIDNDSLIAHVGGL
jgi:hypothetical protein